MRQAHLMAVTMAFFFTLLGTVLLLPATASEINLVANYDFSAGVQANGIPVGWTNQTRSPGEAHYELSSERSVIGEYSLKMVDLSSSAGAGLRSLRSPAQAGVLYRAEADAFVESGLVSVYLEFWAEDKRIETRIVPSTGTGAWERITAELIAPEGTEEVSVILYTSIPNEGIAYFDNVWLYPALD